MSALRIIGLTKAFDVAPVLDRVSLELAEGELLSILGPSGCGKTTLLRVVAGFLRPDAGSISFGGRPVVGDDLWVSPQHRRVGYVAQEGALFPHLDVAANIAFGLPRGQRRARTRVRELLELVELDAALLSRFPHQLSGGQQQRVALARALAPRPSLVLLDEPFAALDAQLRLQTGIAVVHALRAAEASAVLVTHDQSEALSLTDTVAVMRDGQIVQAGPPAQVYAVPRDLGVARFVGDAIVLDADISGGWAQCVLGRIAAVGAVDAGPARIMIRPEQLELGSEGVAAEVGDVAFFGHDAIVHLAVGPERHRVAAQILGGDLPLRRGQVRVRVRGPVRAYPLAAPDAVDPRLKRSVGDGEE